MPRFYLYAAVVALLFAPCINSQAQCAFSQQNTDWERCPKTRQRLCEANGGGAVRLRVCVCVCVCVMLVSTDRHTVAVHVCDWARPLCLAMHMTHTILWLASLQAA